jgi:hypothetical protein
MGAHKSFPWKPVAIGGLVLGGLGILALVSRRSPGQAPAARVALIGDSYAVGLGPELAKLLSPPPFQFEGRVGAGTSGYKIPPWLSTFKPTIVLVSLGVNDGASPNPTNYQTIVQTLHGMGARVMWIEPPAGVNAPAVRAAIASLGVSTVPATTTPLAADGTHPHSYGPWAKDVVQALGRDNFNLLPLVVANA